MKNRNTIQRDLVMEAAKRLDHPTADEVYGFVAGKHPSISRGTVYRNLGLLAAQGRLRKVALPDGADHYDYTLEGHYHVNCRICGRVADVDLPYQHDLAERVKDAGGFLIERHDIVLQGLCPACRTAGTAANA